MDAGPFGGSGARGRDAGRLAKLDVLLYWMHRDGAHNVPAHLGVRTATEKLICYYNDPCDQPGANGPVDPIEWEFFDLASDPFETTNLISDPSRADDVARLRVELERLQAEVGDRWP